MLVIVDDEALGTFAPAQSRACRLCMPPRRRPTSSKARAQRLMGEEETVTADDVLNIDNSRSTLATYRDAR